MWGTFYVIHTVFVRPMLPTQTQLFFYQSPFEISKLYSGGGGGGGQHLLCNPYGVW